MNSTETNVIRSSINQKIIIPISIFCLLISICGSCGILILIYVTKRLHTIAYILICNTCISSIYYSIVQCHNYIYLIFISLDTSNISCRYRAYFSYMSIASIVYSYLIQALSRYFFSKFRKNSRWLHSLKLYYIIILIQWIIIIIIPLPSLITKDIYYRPTFLCWVPKEKYLHVIYTLFVYYFIPIILIISIYINIYKRVKQYEKTNLELIKKKHRKKKKNLKILRNILILIGIYTCSGIPTLIYLISKIEIFYSIGIIFLSLFVAIEKLVIILLDRKIKNILRNYFFQSKLTNKPIILNYHQFINQHKFKDFKIHQNHNRL